MNQRSQAVAAKRGLLARAEAILEAEAKREAKAAKRAQIKRKLRRLAIGATVGLLLPNMLTPSVPSQRFSKFDQGLTARTVTQAEPTDTELAKINSAIREFQQQLPPQVSEQERDMLAQLVYGEAGINAADGYEVIHTVQNRVMSPLFPDTVAAVITQENQYLGYNPNNPVLPSIRKMVDIALMDWNEQHCEHYYFLTDQPGVSNKFEDGTGTDGRWQAHKTYEPRGHYCDVAQRQADTYRQVLAANHETGCYL